VTTALQTETTPPNWYPDPVGRAQARYWDGRMWTSHVVRDGATTLTVTDRLAGLAGAVYGGVGGGVGGGGLSLPIMAAAAVPVLAPVFILGWLGGVFLGAREIYLRAARRRAVALQQLFDALVDDIERALVREKP